MKQQIKLILYKFPYGKKMIERCYLFLKRARLPSYSHPTNIIKNKNNVLIETDYEVFFYKE